MMATSMILDETKVTLSAGGESVEMTGKQLEQVTRRLEREAHYRQSRQAGLDAGEPDEEEGREYTPEDLFEAMSHLVSTQIEHERAREEAKEAKAAMDEAAAELRRIHGKIIAQRRRG